MEKYTEDIMIKFYIFVGTHRLCSINELLDRFIFKLLDSLSSKEAYRIYDEFLKDYERRVSKESIEEKENG